ncbi:LysE family translocator [Phreatobacter stygius]|uniref:LysE family translocator n=1 Tax=Phreatobacter stygius TaxID=1940610 RepID=A0A4D7B9I8_9HYPH|nr:LysE family translocator [Phreatobacter stygius]QCI66196.1 LysE family translocator [Phreatobacter stygius]
MADLGIFVGALAIAYLVPGPDMVLLLETGALRGRGQALATAAGLALARAAHVALAALGLAALLRTSPWTFEVVRLAGAAYLIWLGIAMLGASSLLPPEARPGAGRAAPSYRIALRRGLLTNITNPKALLFCSVLLPQFIRPDQGAVAGQFLLLGTILVGIGLAFDIVLALAGAAIGRWLSRYPLAQTLQRWAFAMLLIGFGARLALSSRPQ